MIIEKLLITQQSSYPSSSVLYDMFTEDNLLAAVNAAEKITSSATSPAPTDKDVRKCIRSVVQQIDFGAVKHVRHEWLNGQPEPAPGYPPAKDIVSTPLLGYRISLGTVPGALPRAVVTAGVHAQEMAPSPAVARYFRQLLVNYVRGKIFLKDNFPSIDHPEFEYQSGDFGALDSFGDFVEGSEHDEVSLSPTIKEKVKIKSCTIASGPEVLRLLEKLEIILLPVVNPSGRDFVLTVGSETDKDPAKDKLIKEVRRSWRKNRAPLAPETNPPNDFGSGAVKSVKIIDKDKYPLRPIGVDINRNADIAWDPDLYYSAGAGAANDKEPHSAYNYDNYVGAKPNSERETCAVIAALTNLTVAQMQDRTTDAKLGTVDLPPAAEAYLGPLFYLDVHSHLGDICLPWGMDGAGEVREQNFLNTDYNKGRDGVPSDKQADIADRAVVKVWQGNSKKYYEYIPNQLKFGASERPYYLFNDHYEIFSTLMQTNIVAKVAAEAEPIEPPTMPNILERIRVRSNYKPVPASALYTTTGVLNDYAFSLNIRGITGLPLSGKGNFTVLKDAERNPARTGPVISLTIEIGRLQDGAYVPIDAQLLHKKETYSLKKQEFFTAGQYQKVEREAFAGIHKFLLTSILYAKGPITKP